MKEWQISMGCRKEMLLFSPDACLVCISLPLMQKFMDIRTSIRRTAWKRWNIRYNDIRSALNQCLTVVWRFHWLLSDSRPPPRSWEPWGLFPNTFGHGPFWWKNYQNSTLLPMLQQEKIWKTQLWFGSAMVCDGICLLPCQKWLTGLPCPWCHGLTNQ